MISIPLGQLFELKYGKSLRKDKRSNGEVPVYGSNGLVDFHNESMVNKPTIIVGRKGSIGEVHLVSTPCWPIDTTYFVASHGKYDYDLEWLYRLLKTLRLQELNRSAAIPGLNREDVYRIEVNLPPLDDQKRIAHLLGKVEGLIARRKQHLQQLDDLLKSVFLEMFGDPVRNEKGWKRTTIGELATDVKYGTSASAQGGPYKYIRMNNITQEGYWNFESLKNIDVPEKDFEKYSIRKGDLVFNRTNSKELVGKTAVYDLDEAVIIAGYLIRVRFREHTNPWFVWGHLNSKYGKTRLFNLCRNIVGMANINAKELQDIPILKPPVNLQNQFATIVEKVENLKSRYQKSLTDMEELYGALSQKAFKGELDLSRVPLPVEVTTRLCPSFDGLAEDTGSTETQRNTKPFPRGFARQILAAEILHRHNNRNMTQMKLQKLIHLAEYHSRLDEIQGEYQRQVAGPFDNKMMYGIAAGVKKQQWFEMHGHGQSATYSPLLKAGSHKKYLLKWQDNMVKVDEILQLLGKARPDQCEIVSTLYAAWNDMLIDGAEITDEMIIEQASKAKLWHKSKENIDPKRWPKALQWMRDHNLVPTGYGKHTQKLQ